MYVVCAVVESENAAEFQDELRDWIETSGAIDHRMYPDDDGSLSIFLDYPSEYEARETAAHFREAWPFRSASLLDDGRVVFVLQAADSQAARGSGVRGVSDR